MLVRSIKLFASAPLNDIHQRSYKTIFNNDTLNALDTATRGGSSITLHGVSQVAAQFLQPSAESEGIAPMVHGWQTPRFRFLMEVEESGIGGSRNIAYYIGHTDYADGATTKPDQFGNVHLDDNLIFFINAVHRLKAQVAFVGGQQTDRLIGERFSQVLYGGSTLANLVNGNGDMQYKMRPIDVFKSRNVLNDLQEYGLLDSTPIDTTGALNYGGEFSSRRNNTPGSYLFDTLHSYQQAKGNVESSGLSPSMISDEAIHMSQDSNAYLDVFYTEMRNVQQNIQQNGQFTWRQLKIIAPHADDILTVITPRDLAVHMNMVAHSTGNINYGATWGAHNTSPWNSSDNETIAATLLVNAIPSIMLENLGADIRFVMTNATDTGEIAWQAHTFETLSPLVDKIHMMNRIMERIKMELMPSITLNNQISINIVVDCSVYGDTMVNISLAGAPERVYVMPTFADNVASPVLTKSVNKFNQLTNDVYTLAEQLMSNKIPQPQIYTGY